MKTSKVGLMIGLFCIISLLSVSDYAMIPDNLIKNEEPVDILSSDFWNLTSSTIFIDDSDPNYNWSKMAIENDWISGLGTWDDPYRIENVTLIGNNTASGIKIQNSYNVYFVINNCSVSNSTLGIELINVNNGTVENNDINNNTDMGISLQNCKNITIENNQRCIPLFILVVVF